MLGKAFLSLFTAYFLQIGKPEKWALLTLSPTRSSRAAFAEVDAKLSAHRGR
jgi:hypothetical protein